MKLPKYVIVNFGLFAFLYENIKIGNLDFFTKMFDISYFSYLIDFKI